MQNRQIAHVWLGITLEQPHMYDRLAEHSHTAQTSEAVEALATPTSIRSGALARATACSRRRSCVGQGDGWK